MTQRSSEWEFKTFYIVLKFQFQKEIEDYSGNKSSALKEIED